MKSQSTFEIFAHNKKTLSYDALGFEESNCRAAAVSSWCAKNPKRAQVISRIPDVKITALVYGGGI